MKKRTAFIGAILSLIPLGQTLIIKTGVSLSTIGIIIFYPKQVNAQEKIYFKSAFEKAKAGDHYGAISDYTKAIEINPNYALAFANRGSAKESIGDMKGACADWQKASQLGDQDATQWVRKQC